MRLPIDNMTWEEVLKAYRWRCPLPGHTSHNGLEHPQCYLRFMEKTFIEGYFDIETSQLKGNWGVILCWHIKRRDSDVFEYDYLRKEDFEAKTDKRIVASLVDALSKYSVIYTYYGTEFDIRFARTRALQHGLGFPSYNSIRHIDVYSIAKSRLSLHSYRKEVVAKALNIEVEEKPLEPNTWIKALFGDEDALKYIVEHNRVCVIQTELIHRKLESFQARTRRSI